MSTPRPRTILLAEDRWATIRHVVEAVAIVLAGFWAFYTFIYQEQIKPAGQGAALVPTMTIERIGRDAKRDVLRVVVHLRNTGKTEIDIAADAYNVWGERYGNRAEPRTIDEVGRRRYSDVVPRISRRLILSFSELRDAAVGGPPARIVIQPGAENFLTEVIVVPRGAYDVLRGQAIAVPVKFPSKEKVHVQQVRHADGAAWLEAAAPAFEDDTDVEYALIP